MPTVGSPRSKHDEYAMHVHIVFVVITTVVRQGKLIQFLSTANHIEVPLHSLVMMQVTHLLVIYVKLKVNMHQ